MKVWLNGKFIDRDRAAISVFDSGFQHGVGLFETLAARDGEVLRLDAHLARLTRSAEELRLTTRLREGPLADAVNQAYEESGRRDARIRLTLTGGDLNPLVSRGESVHDPTILIVVQPPTPYPREFFDDGVVVALADGRANPFDPHAGHKTLAYWPRISALQIASARGAAEAIWFSVSNHLASGSVSNIFLVKDDQLLTPYARGEEEEGALHAPVLPGVTRNEVIHLAAGEGIVTERRMLDIDDLLGAEEVFLTNSSWGILPVAAVEREKIGAGEVGGVTRRLIDLLDLRLDPEA